MAETQTQARGECTYLDAEVPSVHIVAKEQIAGGAGGSAHLEKLHQVKELAVDITTHWTQTHAGVGNLDACSSSLLVFGFFLYIFYKCIIGVRREGAKGKPVKH